MPIKKQQDFKGACYFLISALPNPKRGLIPEGSKYWDLERYTRA